MKRTSLQRKIGLNKPGFQSGVRKIGPKMPQVARNPRKGRKGPSDLKRAKLRLWELMRTIQFQRYGKKCYTCDASPLEGSNCQLGHFITKSTCSAELAYSLDNTRPQCAACNIWKSGNWVAFEKRLKVERGVDFPEYLKKRNQDTTGEKYDLQWYQEQVARYTAILEKETSI